MANEEKVLVLTTRAWEPAFAMLSDVPHLIGTDVSMFSSAAKEATVILNWTGSRDLLHEVFLICPKLKWIHSKSAGLDSKMFPELISSDMPLTNGSGVFSQSLGEFVLAAILYFAKDIPRMRRSQLEGIWAPFDVEEIAGQSVGIVGYGDIGRAVASRVKAMGMRVLATKRHLPKSPDPLVERYYPLSELHEMLSQCDYVVVAAPLTSETHHMLSDAEFAAMKPTATVINVGRGPIIDELAMIRALKEKRIRAAGLDVFEQEPLPAESPLYRMDNVLLSPHCADNTKDWNTQAMQFFLEQYKKFKNHEPLLNVVDKRLGY